MRAVARPCGPEARLAARRAALDLILQRNSFARFALLMNLIAVFLVMETDDG